MSNEKKLAIKIIEVVLQEVNGYDKEEAEELAPNEVGSNLYSKIVILLQTHAQLKNPMA